MSRASLGRVSQAGIAKRKCPAASAAGPGVDSEAELVSSALGQAGIADRKYSAVSAGPSVDSEAVGSRTARDS